MIECAAPIRIQPKDLSKFLFLLPLVTHPHPHTVRGTRRLSQCRSVVITIHGFVGVGTLVLGCGGSGGFCDNFIYIPILKLIGFCDTLNDINENIFLQRMQDKKNSPHCKAIPTLKFIGLSDTSTHYKENYPMATLNQQPF
jgi:hypothetical protein